MNYEKYLIGFCYCENPTGEPDKNGLICISEGKTERFAFCHDDEGCIGPTTPNAAQLFSRKIFCSKGEIKRMQIKYPHRVYTT